MDRRTFLQAGAAAPLTSLTSFSALSSLAHADVARERKPRRVALIGCGWYGKCDLLRLLQIEPVEVVAMCDVDSKMLAEAADIVAARQVSKKRPRTHADYRELLAEKDAEMVLIATPDHWHALPMIAAVEAGADVYVQKPISVDIVEGQAMLAAARRTGRVVQVGTQRRSTPHLIEARDQIVRPGKLGKVGLVEIYCYYHMRSNQSVPDSAPPANLDYEMWTGPAPMRPFNSLVHPRRWRYFQEYGNGIVGDMCIHMLDTVRWMLDLGWPKSVSSSGGILVDKQSKANISDTQSAVFDFGDVEVVWQHRTWGSAPDPQYPWGATLYGDQGTLKASVNSYDFIPNKGDPIHRDVVMELDKYPEDRDEKDLEKQVAPAIRGHMRDWLQAIDTRGKPVADIEQGHISTASCILANLSSDLGRTLHWDIAAGNIRGDEKANERLRRPYRAPWIHPEVRT
ncbi:MAG: Gfo/Idh/MocA family oxidoreductase [Planctomycetia bacterium]|nr:Gfo/Idh/MocA family oxidoreductase [Planctomycetia bacterium]